jgi:hypothetical protein
MNQTSTQVNDFETPLEEVFSTHFKLNSLFNLVPKVFGCTIYACLKNSGARNLNLGQKNVFLRIEQNKKDINAIPGTKKLFIIMNVIFLEHELGGDQ